MDRVAVDALAAAPPLVPRVRPVSPRVPQKPTRVLLQRAAAEGDVEGAGGRRCAGRCAVVCAGLERSLDEGPARRNVVLPERRRRERRPPPC